MANQAPFVIQPYLTSIALTYRNQKLIADQVLPRIQVLSTNFKWSLYDKERFVHDPQHARRAQRESDRNRLGRDRANVVRQRLRGRRSDPTVRHRQREVGPEHADRSAGPCDGAVDRRARAVTRKACRRLAVHRRQLSINQQDHAVRQRPVE